ncbi:MAG: RNA methyltransferase [Planctomycetaceae bacterium]|nr:RNA methyltransferase [Planctomycetaceae bacterium]
MSDTGTSIGSREPSGPSGPVAIIDPTDPRVAGFADVREKELAARTGLFVGETLVVLEAMLLRPETIRAVLASPRMLERTRTMLAEAHCAAPLYTAEDAVLEALTGIDLHRGVLALAERAAFEAIDPVTWVPASPPRTVLVAEDITNIDNIGQLFRIAAAFAVDAVLLSPECHDPLYRKSLRVSTGNALKVQALRARRWPEDLVALRERFGLSVVATAIQSSVPIASIGEPARVAVVVGHESEGVSAAVRALADHIVRIPMAAGVDSLNVAVSAAIALDRLSRGDRA